MTEEQKAEVIELFYNQSEYPKHTVAQLASMFNTEPSQIIAILDKYDKNEKYEVEGEKWEQ